MLKNRKPIDLLNLARLIENLPTKLLKSCTRDRTVQYNAWVISDDLLGRPAFYAIFVTPRVDQQLVIGLPAHRFAECGPLLVIGAIVFLLFFFSRRTCFFFYKDPKKLQGYTARFQKHLIRHSVKNCSAKQKELPIHIFSSCLVLRKIQ